MLRGEAMYELLTADVRNRVTSLDHEDVRHLLQQLLIDGRSTSAEGAWLQLEADVQLAEKLRRWGYLDSPSECRYCFPSPLHMMYYR